jgi:hypothetical protein
VVIANLPRDSAFVRSVLGEQADWSLTDHLLAAIFDTLASANWQRGGGKGRRPKPLPRPGMQDASTKRFGTVVTIEEARKRWPRKSKEP